MYANIFVVMGVSMEKISYEKFVKLVAFIIKVESSKVNTIAEKNC